MRISLQQHPLSTRRGFTLMELMVVVALIAIMTAMIIPEMKGTFEDALLRSTARDLVSAIEMANSRAVSLNQTHRLHIDPVSHEYLLEKRDSSGREDEFVSLEDVVGGKGQLDERILIDVHDPESSPGSDPQSQHVTPSEPVTGSFADRNTITFQPDGTADAKELVLRDRAGFRLALRINPITARVRIVELEQK